MPTIEEMIENEESNVSRETLENEQIYEKVRFEIPNFLKAKSIDKSIEEYTEHPLNFDKKRSTSHILRGLEGLLGAINYAIIDIFMGVIEKWRENK